MLLHRRRGALLGLVLSGAAAASAQAQANLPPVARASALPTQVAPGDPVQLMGSSSFDPDMGPSALTIEWDFGDGMTSTVPDPTHAWASAGIYPASLTVRDGQTQSLALVEIHVLDPPTPSPPTASSPIWLDEANGRIWAVNPDSGTVSVVDLASASVAVELDVGVRPVSVRGGGSRVLVAVQGEGLVVTFDRDAMTRTGELAVGPRPYGVTDVPGSGEWLVALEASDRVVRLASDAGSIVATYDVCDGPRALAVEHAGDRAFAACFLSRGDAGHVSAIDLANGTVSDVALAEDPGPDTATSGRGIPSLLGALAIDPAGGRLWVGGLKANTGRGVHVNGEPLVFTNRLRALFAPIDLTDLGDLVQRRIDANDADSVSAIAFDHSGRWAFLAHAGAGRVSSYDLSRARFFVPGVDGDTVPFAARFDVGDAPSGLALSSDGTRLYVWSELSRELRIVDVTDPAVPSELSAIRLT
ncbi:MAG: PKD domain-containing protein, partial [Sandaracinaceae bacterium]